MSLVWDLQLPLSRKMVLLSLADQANDAGEAFPSFANVMRRCGMARRTLFECLLDLEKDGFITRIPVGLQKVIFQVNEDALRQQELLDPTRSENVKPVRQPHQCEIRTGAKNSKTPVRQPHSIKQPSKSNHQSLEQRAAARGSEAFERWWAAYPKKVGKKPCITKWKAKKLDAMVDRLVADVEKRIAEDGRWLDGYIPNPATYLTQERWEDELQPRRDAPKPAPATSARDWRESSENPLEKAVNWARQQRTLGLIDAAECERLIAEATEKHREAEAA